MLLDSPERGDVVHGEKRGLSRNIKLIIMLATNCIRAEV